MRIIEPEITIQPYNGLEIMKNIERAMRVCYRSEGMITEDSYNRLLKTAIDGGHESVLEHEKISILMTCSINTYKDLTRHRAGASFSIESTRWNNYSKGKFGNELTFINPKYIDNEFKYEVWNNCMQSIEDYYMDMAKVKAKPDELRTMLPHSIASEVYMTCNIREWRHILKLRTNNRVHPEIRQLLIPLLLKFKEDMPILFEDIDYDKDFNKDWYADIEVRDLKELDDGSASMS